MRLASPEIIGMYRMVSDICSAIWQGTPRAASPFAISLGEAACENATAAAAHSHALTHSTASETAPAGILANPRSNGGEASSHGLAAPIASATGTAAREFFSDFPTSFESAQSANSGSAANAQTPAKSYLGNDTAKHA